MDNVDKGLPYDVNAQFLKEQITQGKDFVLTSNPDEEIQVGENAIKSGDNASSYYNELQQLKANGYHWTPESNGIWRATK